MASLQVQVCVNGKHACMCVRACVCVCVCEREVLLFPKFIHIAPVYPAIKWGPGVN